MKRYWGSIRGSEGRACVQLLGRVLCTSLSAVRPCGYQRPARLHIRLPAISVKARLSTSVFQLMRLVTGARPFCGPALPQILDTQSSLSEISDERGLAAGQF